MRRKSNSKDLSGALELKGFSVWWDPNLDHGDRFDEVIQQKLDAAKCVMVLWSVKSVKSKWVRAEARLKYYKNQTIIIDKT
ncbi:MAG: toll/interleukin-1 receptor domain-containing protein [Candidatus Methanoperedens sp.]